MQVLLTEPTDCIWPPPPPNKTTPKDIIKQAVREIIISVYDERPLLLGLRDLVIYSILSYDRSASLK